MKAYGNCSKNYIDCRKHPARTTSAAERVNEDFKAYQGKIKEDLAAAQTELKAAELDPTTKKAKLNRLSDVVEKLELDNHALGSQARFNRHVKGEEAKIGNLSGRERLTARHALDDYRNIREQTLSDIKRNVDTEIELQNLKPLEGFKLAVAKLLIQDGTAVNDGEPDWGSTLGRTNYGATEHLRNDCEPVAISDYEDTFTWSTYDSFNSSDSIGTRARISCKCGEVHKQNFVIESNEVGSMFSRLMNM